MYCMLLPLTLAVVPSQRLRFLLSRNTQQGHDSIRDENPGIFGRESRFDKHAHTTPLRSISPFSRGQREVQQPVGPDRALPAQSQNHPFELPER